MELAMVSVAFCNVCELTTKIREFLYGRWCAHIGHLRSGGDESVGRAYWLGFLLSTLPIRRRTEGESVLRAFRRRTVVRNLKRRSVDMVAPQILTTRAEQ